MEFNDFGTDPFEAAFAMESQREVDELNNQDIWDDAAEKFDAEEYLSKDELDDDDFPMDQEYDDGRDYAEFPDDF